MMATSLILEIGLKALDIFIINSNYRSKLQRQFIKFIEQYSTSVKNNAKIKRRYDELMAELRKEEGKKNERDRQNRKATREKGD